MCRPLHVCQRVSDRSVTSWYLNAVESKLRLHASRIPSSVESFPQSHLSSYWVGKSRLLSSFDYCSLYCPIFQTKNLGKTAREVRASDEQLTNILIDGYASDTAGRNPKTKRRQSVGELLTRLENSCLNLPTIWAQQMSYSVLISYMGIIQVQGPAAIRGAGSNQEGRQQSGGTFHLRDIRAATRFLRW